MSSAAQSPDSNPPFVHPTAIIEDRCTLGAGVKVWHHSQLRTGCQIGEGVSIGKSCFIDSEVSIGPHSRIQNGVSVYAGVDICSWVFIGPNVTFTNDLLPRAGRIKWTRVATHIENGASIGAGAVILCGVRIGTFSMIGAGSTVTKDVKPFTLNYGSPARPLQNICACGANKQPLDEPLQTPFCPDCAESLDAKMIELARVAFANLPASDR